MKNPICHFAIVRYLWSEADKIRFYRDGEPAGRVWNLPKNTPVVPLSFIGSNWTSDWQPRGNRNLIAGLVDIASRPGSIVVLDLYPETCLRLPHGRSVIASEHLKSSLGRSHRGVLKKGMLDPYCVDGDDLIDTVTAPQRGEPQVTLGYPGSTVQAAKYYHFLQEVH